MRGVLKVAPFQSYVPVAFFRPFLDGVTNIFQWTEIRLDLGPQNEKPQAFPNQFLVSNLLTDPTNLYGGGRKKL